MSEDTANQAAQNNQAGQQGASQTEGQTPAQQADTGAGEQATQNKAFLESLPEGLRANPAFKDVTDAASLAQRYADLTAKTAPPPSEKDYAYKPQNGEKVDPAMMGAFKKAAFEAGMNNAQFNQLVGWWNQTMAGEAKARQQSSEAGLAKLQQDWGAKYQDNVKTAQKAITSFASPEFGAFLDKTGLGSHPEMIKMFAAIGERISEGKVFDGKSGLPASTGNPANVLYPNLS
jgi:hypothetical protein